MSSDVAVRLVDVEKVFPARSDQPWRAAVPAAGWTPTGNVALRDVDLEVRRGEAVGIIGPNGAGKSTLLRLLAGVISPTRGHVETSGRIGAMIDLGLGFHPALSGTDNALIAGALLGVDRPTMERRLPEIARFSGLDDVMDAPLGEYSSGMVARLGFATAINVDADVLLVDEVLSVGDREFQERCLQQIARMVDAGTTLLFVSHDTPVVRAVCDRVVVVRDGQLVDDGPAAEVIDGYLGRRGPRLASGPPAARIDRLDLAEELLQPHQPAELVADVTVERPADVVALEATLTMPSIDPDLVIARAQADLPPALLAPGSHHLEIRTSPIPLEGGRLRLTVSLLDDDGAAWSHESCELAMDGPVRIRKPMYAVGSTVRLTPTEPTDRSVPPPPPPPPERALVRCEGVTKVFPSHRRGAALASALLLPDRLGRRGGTVALDGVDVAVAPGECVGIIGPNGAGKSTLLRCIAGIMRPDSGTVQVDGRVIPILELGVGFQPDLTGWENLEITWHLMGLDGGELGARQEQIVRFSGVGDAMDRPIKHWSTGMRARLGFSLAAHAPGDVLLVDELLAVGDLEFQRQATERVESLRDDGRAVLLVSHDLRLVGTLCNRAVRLEHGRVVDAGPTDAVIDRYGGVGWAGGADLGTGPVRFHDLALAEEAIPSGGMAQLTALVQVDEASPDVRLEVSFRDPSARVAASLTAEELEMRSISLFTAVPERTFDAPGWWRLDVEMGPWAGHGAFHVVLTAVDARDGTYLAEAWTTLRVGRGRSPDAGGPADFTFAVDLDVPADPARR